MTYAPPEHWDDVFRRLRSAGEDLDWRGRWTEAAEPHLREVGAQTVLDLGCGTGNDVLRLAARGFLATGLDFSGEAIAQGRAKARGVGLRATFVQADMARPLPFADGAFDAVTSNVALHMFGDAVTRAVFAEVRRVLRGGGVFVFHVNSDADAELRARRRPAVRELEPGCVLEQDGQTMRFFSAGYLRDLLSAWADVRLDHVEIADEATGEPFKRVWRGVARS